MIGSQAVQLGLPAEVVALGGGLTVVGADAVGIEVGAVTVEAWEDVRATVGLEST